jgi:CRP-like cAMP-binding protein
MSATHFVRKLGAFSPLGKTAETAIAALASGRVRKCDGGLDLIAEGDEPQTVYLVLEGWACRYKTLEDGRRQILALFVPGDLCDLHVYILSRMDHSIGALTPLQFAMIGPKELEQLGDDHPRVMRALLWESLVTASIQREWLVSAGQRSALEALAHLLCEIYFRLKLVGLVEKGQCDFPLTQFHLADALGMTQPHISRTVRELNATRLVTLKQRKLTVHDASRLCELAGFNPNYLHHR